MTDVTRDEIGAAEAARLLGVTVQTIRNHCRAGTFPARMIFCRWRIPRAAIERIQNGGDK